MVIPTRVYFTCFNSYNVRKKQDVAQNMDKKVKDKLVMLTQIPYDIAYSLPNIEIKGNREIYIENYKSIIEYTNDRIRLKLKGMQLSIEGNGLCIEYYTKDSMLITGRIRDIKFL